MSHILKEFLKIIQQSIYRKCEEQQVRRSLASEQEWELSTCYSKEKNTTKVFTHVSSTSTSRRPLVFTKYDKLIENLSTNLDPSDIRLIQNIYYKQTAVVLVEDMDPDDIKIQKEVRESYVLSPQLLNLY